MTERLVIYTEDAKRFGLCGAIVVGILRDACNTQNGHEIRVVDGKTWVALSPKDLSVDYPFVSRKTWQRVFSKLAGSGAIRIATFEGSNKVWCSLHESDKVSKQAETICPQSSPVVDKMSEPICPAETPDHTDDIDACIEALVPKRVSNLFGEQMRVPFPRPKQLTRGIIKAYVDAYNSVASERGWIIRRTLNLPPTDMNNLRRYINDNSSSLDGFVRLLQDADSDFLAGNNSRGWRADFSWAIRPGTIAKLRDRAWKK